MHRFSSVLFIFTFWLILTSCETKEEKCVFIPDTSEISIDLEFNQLQNSFADVSSKQQLIDLLTQYPAIRDFFLRRQEYPNDSVFINALYDRFTHPAFDTLLMETERIFGDLSQLQAEFKQAFANLKYYYPDFNPPKIQTIVTGLDNDLLVTDTLIVIGLDYYLGSTARYRPKMYDYLLRQYEEENIVPSCLLIYGIGNQFNNTNLNDKTVLADMIAYGKSYYFAKRMLPCTPDSIFIWYTPEEIEGANDNQDLIWARLIEDQVLFSTNHVVKQKFLGERPKTLEVGEKCPGRIAQWVGWEIVNEYMETHPETSLPELMKISDARKIFNESQYKPQRR